MSCMMRDPRDREAGLSLIEVSVGMTISVFIIAAILMMQSAAGQAFESSSREQQLTQSLRNGVKVVREQLRGARPDSVVVANEAADGVARLTFVEAIDFDLDTGTSTWGAGGVEEATVEFYVDDDELWRRIRLPSDEVQEGSEERILSGLVDRSNFNAFVLTWDAGADSMDLSVFIEVPDGNEGVVRARRVSTVVHVEPVFNF